MLRPLVAVALLALSSLAAPAQAQTSIDALDILDALPAVARPVVVGSENPLLAVDGLEAARLVTELGYADAARAIALGNARSSAAAQPEPEEGEPMEEETDDEPLDLHGFLPLGDVNGNGRDDVILVTVDGDDDSNITFEALDGGRRDDVLWSLRLGEDEYAYLAGDVDEDGIYDLERFDDGDHESSMDGDGNYQARTTVTILSGRDLAPLATLTIKSESTSSETHPEPLPVGRTTYYERYSFEYVDDLSDQPGFARITWIMESSSAQEGVGPFPTSVSYTFNDSRSYALLSPDGALVWAFEEKGWNVDYDEGDATGDGIPEVVLHRTDNYHYSSSANIIPPFVDPPVTTPLDPTEPQRPAFEVRVLDGATGDLLWGRELGNSSYSYTSWYGDLYGNGPVLRVFAIDLEAQGSGGLIDVLLDGKTGETVRELDRGTGLLDLGDANGDGLDDLMAIDYDDDTWSFAGMDGQFNELWTLTLDDELFGGVVDITGDGVVDILALRDDNVTVYSGTDGDASWDREQENVWDLDLSAGIINPDGYELSMLLTEAEEDEEFANFPAEIFMLRGADGAPLWNKPVYDPDDYLPVAADDAVFYLSSAGDLNGDGANDFILDLLQGYTISVSTTCVNGDCETEIEDSRDDDVGQPLAITALVDGASGATYLRFDDMKLAPKVEVVKEEAVEVKPAAEELTEDKGTLDVPGLGLYAILVTLGVAVVLSRRNK